MPYMNTITLGGYSFYRPNDFQPAREFVYSAEYTTMNGGIRADLVGWKYSDITLKWDALPPTQLANLIGLNGSAVTLTFTDADNQTATETVIPLTHSLTATKYVNQTKPVWRDVETELRFIDVH